MLHTGGWCNLFCPLPACVAAAVTESQVAVSLSIGQCPWGTPLRQEWYLVLSLDSVLWHGNHSSIPAIGTLPSVLVKAMGRTCGDSVWAILVWNTHGLLSFFPESSGYSDWAAMVLLWVSSLSPRSIVTEQPWYFCEFLRFTPVIMFWPLAFIF